MAGHLLAHCTENKRIVSAIGKGTFLVALHMSAIGPKRTCLVALHMSAFGGKADIANVDRT